MEKTDLSQENLFLIDWLTFTTTFHGMANIYDLLGMSPDMFTDAQVGRYGYSRRLFCGGISILYGGYNDEMGICVEMSGQGCRDFETLGNGNYTEIFLEILENPTQMHITRLDIAFDDHTGLLDVQHLCRETLALNWVSRWTKYRVEYSDEGTSCLFGSKQSEMYLRFYDKAAERGLSGVHWSRAEMVLKRQRAFEFIRILFDEHDGKVSGIQALFWGVLNNYLRFVVPSEDDSNKSRWETASWWSDFVGEAIAVQLFVKPGAEYNLYATERYVYNQSGNSLLTLIMCRGLDAIVDGIIHRDPLFSAKYQNLAKRAGVAEDISLSSEKMLELQNYVQRYREEYGLDKLWSPEWVEDDNEPTPFDGEWTELSGWGKEVRK